MPGLAPLSEKMVQLIDYQAEVITLTVRGKYIRSMICIYIFCRKLLRNVFCLNANLLTGISSNKVVPTIRFPMINIRRQWAL